MTSSVAAIYARAARRRWLAQRRCPKCAPHRPLAPGCKLCRPCLAVQANDNARRVRS